MKYKINNDKVFSDVMDNIAILIDMETGVYYGLNQCTTNVYENIVAGVDTDELLVALASVKGFDENVGKKYSAMVDELVSKDFILEDPSGYAVVNLNFDSFNDDELDFELSAYPDASELLLADPIHQVKDDLGWQPSKEALK